MFDFDTPLDMVQTNGGRLAYYRFGRGPDVVAVHGWPLHSATFRTLLPHLVSDYTVHLFDLPGAGRTEWHGPIDLDTSARALGLAIEVVGLREYALVAHDSGGLMARLVAADNPRVRAVAISGSEIPGHHGNALKAFLFIGKRPVLARMFVSALQNPSVARSRFAFGTCFTDPRYVDGDFTRLFIEPLRDPRIAGGQLAHLRAFDFEIVDRLRAVHARIQAPALCIWGDEDRFFPIEKARQMLPQFAGGASLVAIPGAKLFCHEDHPEELAAHLRPFLAERLSAARTVDAPLPSSRQARDARIT